MPGPGGPGVLTLWFGCHNYSRPRRRAQQEGGYKKVKISGLEKGVLALTAAFLLVTAGYFAGTRSTAEPYRVDVEYLQSRETPQSPAAAGSGPAAGEKVNLNTATARELETLPGIGESLARRIIAYREANGPFGSIEEIMEVSGIGEAKFAELEDRVTVDNGKGEVTNEDSGG